VTRARYYDPPGRRLVYLQEAADPGFWDAQWSAAPRRRLYGPVPARSLVVRQTRRFVPAGGLVLEGGCGLAQNAWHLHRSGYRTLALDSVPRTLFEVGRHVPEVRPVRGDVRTLPLPDAGLDAYWSIGVIEHWYSGYGEARDEMARVVAPGGHLFLTFPYMSPLRRLRARLGVYPEWTGDGEGRESFYQFALDPRPVVRDFEAAGFRLVAKRPFLGVRGLEEELPPRLARRLEATQGPGAAARGLRACLATALRPWTSHCILLVLRKEPTSAAGSGEPR
jgi:SAM-dependent methyltransferase